MMITWEIIEDTLFGRFLFFLILLGGWLWMKRTGWTDWREITSGAHGNH